MSKKKKRIEHTRNCIEYLLNEDFLIESIISDLKTIQEKTGADFVEISAPCYGGECYHIYMTPVTKRLETDEEEEQRIQMEKRKEEAIREEELSEYQRLKQKYDS